MSGIVYFLSFPPIAAGVTAFVALVPLQLAACPTHDGSDEPRRPGRGEAFFLGWLCCTVAGTLLIGPSMFEAARRYFQLPVVPSLLAGALAPQLYAAPYFAIFALIAREVAARHRGPELTALGLAAAWTACELGRARFGDGMPWLLLAHSQVDRLHLLQIADLAGAPGVSFLVALVNSAIAVALLELRRRLASRHDRVAASVPSWAVLVRLGGVVAAIVGGAALYGHFQLQRWSAGDRPSIRVALIQGNLPDAWRYSLASLPEALRHMRNLTLEVGASRPELIVWPENAVSVSVDENLSALRSLVDSLRGGAHLLIGGPRAVPSTPGRAVLRNSAFLLDETGRVAGTYDKRRLIMWAEAAPWPVSHLPFTRPAALGDYTPGDSPALLEVHGTRFGTLICSEAIYAPLARESVRAGAEVLVNIGNDGWFGTQPAASQHLDAALLRAVENRRPMLRATATGITAVIDARGAVIAAAPQGRPASLVVDVVPQRGQTIYTRFGDVFGWACVVLTAAALYRRGSRRRPACAAP